MGCDSDFDQSFIKMILCDENMFQKNIEKATKKRKSY